MTIIFLTFFFLVKFVLCDGFATFAIITYISSITIRKNFYLRWVEQNIFLIFAFFAMVIGTKFAKELLRIAAIIQRLS